MTVAECSVKWWKLVGLKLMMKARDSHKSQRMFIYYGKSVIEILIHYFIHSSDKKVTIHTKRHDKQMLAMMLI